jgi:hypothetical protein
MMRYANDAYPVFLKGGVTVSTFFGILALISFFLVIPVVRMTDSHREGEKLTGTFFFGILLTLFIVGVAGCIAESG